MSNANNNIDDQSDEVIALASIYDESVFKMQKDVHGLYSGTVVSHIELAKPYSVKLISHGRLFSPKVCLFFA